jgi:hypothetical protein
LFGKIWLRGRVMENGIKVLNELSWGYRASRLLQVASGLGIFTVLSGEVMRAEEIAEKCRSKAGLTEKLLIGCAAMGLLEKKEGRYKNSALAEKYLVRGGELYQGDIIAHSANVMKWWNGLEGEIRIEEKRGDKEAEGHRNFIMGMANIAAAGRAQIFVEKIDLTGRRKLLDIGGGPGSYSIAACRQYRELEAVVFDLPETIAITRQIIAEEGMGDRVSVAEGDWARDSFGEGGDAVLLSNVLHGAGSGAEMKLGKARDSLVDGGLLVVQEFLLNDGKSGPLVPALFNIMVGAYSEGELLWLIKEAGFAGGEIVVRSEEIGSSWITAEKV